MTMYQKAKIVSDKEDSVIKKIGAYDDMWVQVGEPKPWSGGDLGVGANGEVVQSRKRFIGKMYITNIRLIDKSGKHTPVWARIPWENVELEPRFLDDEKEELPVYRLEVRV